MTPNPDSAAAATAVVLVNLGTPDAPTPAAVRRYLSEFLHDHRVVQMTRWLWCPLLHFVILPVRGKPVAHKYETIWMPGPEGGSPLAVHTRDLARAMQRVMPEYRVVDAMRYGNPKLPAVLARLRADGIERALVVPLYPQYSTTTTASVGDVVERTHDMSLRMLDEYHLAPEWVAAVADSIRTHRAAHGGDGHLLFSFHGLPQRLADAGDPYPQQCEASANAIAEALGLRDGEWSLSYQSRFGRERWLEPATDATLDALAARGIKQVDVVAPGFAVDCLETLEEVSIMLAEQFAAHGGELRYVPCLNASPAHAEALAAIARRALADA